MPRLVVVLPLAALVLAGCGGSGPRTRSAQEVRRVLEAAHLAPHRVTLTVTLEAATPQQPPPLDVAVNLPAAEPEPSTSFEVDGGRALVTVYESLGSAELHGLYRSPRLQRARNVVAVALRGTLSPRLRAALRRLR
jgi:hypothetical protein